MELIVTHQNADFDAIASMLGASKLYTQAIPILPDRINRNVNEFLALYRNGLPFINQADSPVKDINRIIITDTQTSPTLEYIYNAIGDQKTVDTIIIEHHAMKRPLKDYEALHYEEIGAITTWFVEQIREKSIVLNSLEATLLALGIYEDTGMLTYGTTTVRDAQAITWLLQQRAVVDTIRRFLSHPLDDQQQDLFEQLLNQMVTRTIQGYHICIATATANSVISGINSVTGQLRDIIDPTGLFVLVKMPHGIQLVCRSNHDAVDVSVIARHFKGGGHQRAAAATIHKQSIETVTQTIWDTLYQIVQPATRVADLMSYGIQTVAHDAPIGDIIQHIRRIGHEGYPVVDANKRIVGLLSLRDADRAIEHDLEATEVSEVMQSGDVWLHPEDSVHQLEQLMVNSGWGQLPVVDQQRELIGIVTRTDLINHWAKTHPNDATDTKPYQANFNEVFGDDIQHLIDQITSLANTQQLALYMVGGCVRDLILERANYDIDFVVEGDAIQFARALQQQYGGRIHSYEPFGTAKWHLDADVAVALAIDPNMLPDHIDFSTARSELYAHPTALPTVYHSGIKLDLRRRDFTINTLAIQLSPKSYHGRLHDYYGGMNDIESRLIRVLHSLSFIDDPTRILRAIRFSERLEFAIEIRTIELIQTALPMLGRITGERVYNELNLLHNEINAKRGWQKLQALGILSAIHPALQFNAQTLQYWEKYESNQAVEGLEITHARWLIVMAGINVNKVRAVCDRLLLGKRDTQYYYDLAYLVQEASYLHNSSTYNSSTSDTKADDLDRPSYITHQLNQIHEPVWQMAMILMEGTYGGNILRQYADNWRNLRPYTDGNRLIEMGVSAGPIYRHILETLRDAWLDGIITTREQEDLMLQKLLNA